MRVHHQLNLAKHGMEATSLTRSLNSLENLSDRKKKDPNDKRKIIIHLTEFATTKKN